MDEFATNVYDRTKYSKQLHHSHVVGEKVRETHDRCWGNRTLLFPSLESQIEDKDGEREEEDDICKGEDSVHAYIKGWLRALRAIEREVSGGWVVDWHFQAADACRAVTQTWKENKIYRMKQNDTWIGQKHNPYRTILILVAYRLFYNYIWWLLKHFTFSSPTKVTFIEFHLYLCCFSYKCLIKCLKTSTLPDLPSPVSVLLCEGLQSGYSISASVCSCASMLCFMYM